MLKSFLSLWLKFPCPLCQRTAENVLCSYCKSKLLSYKFKYPQQNWKEESPLFAWGRYDGELSRAIAQLKYHNHPEVGTILGQWLGESWLQNCPVAARQKLIVLPIPLSSEKLQARGFNQAELIAQGFCQATNQTLNNQGLVRVKNTLAMFGLTPTQRDHNIKNAFEVSKTWQKKPPHYPVLLVDDIYTRGTTVKEATKTLRRFEVKVLGAIAVAKVSDRFKDNLNLRSTGNL